MLDARLTLTRRHPHLAVRRAIGLGPLQQRDVLQFGHATQGIEQVAQHAAIGFDLQRVRPAGDEARQFKDRSVDHVGHVT